MKKWIVILIISIIAVVLAVLGVLIIISNSHSTLSFAPQDNVSSNRNNVDYNCFDYQNGRFAYLDYRFLKKELILIDTESNHKYFSGIDDEFAIVGNKIIFIKYPNIGDNSKLMSKDIDTGKTELLHNYVIDFVIYENYIIYRVANYSDDSISNYLYIYDLNSGNNRILSENIDAFCINGDSLYIVTDDINPKLLSISLKDFFYKNIITFDNCWIRSIMPCGDKLLLYVSNSFKLLDLTTKEIKSQGWDFTTGANNDFVCDENNIYLTYQAIRYRTPFVENIESEYNGLWKINLETFEKEKILSGAFWDLYLAGNGQLFGTLDGVPYLIDTETKQIQKIID